jgi:SAM-dependent methyltransferase
MHVTALEYQREKADFAEALLKGFDGRVTTKCGSAYCIPEADNTFDSVFSHTVFEHLDNPSLALREIHRVLKPGGYCLISYNFIHNQGGHHLFPYIHFPWAPWIVREQSLCRYWSDCLAKDQESGRGGFFAQGCRIESLSEGAEIHLNRIDFLEFYDIVIASGLMIDRIWESDLLARIFPIVLKLPYVNKFLTETIYYVVRKPTLCHR